jgi:hypothetical protein
VVVEGGGANLYEISDSGGRYYSYHVRVHLLSNDRNSIGSATSLDDALALIKSHSGRRIKSID